MNIIQLLGIVASVAIVADIAFACFTLWLSYGALKYSMLLWLVKRQPYPDGEYYLRYSPFDIVRMALALRSVDKFHRSIDYGKLNYWLNTIDHTIHAINTQFKIDDDSQMNPIHYKVGFERLVEVMLKAALLNPSIRLVSTDSNQVKIALAKLLSKSEIDYGIYPQSEIDFMVDEFLYWYRLMSLPVSLVNIPAYVLLARMGGFTYSHIIEELVNDRWFFKNNVNRVRFVPNTTLREKVKVQRC